MKQRKLFEMRLLGLGLGLGLANQENADGEGDLVRLVRGQQTTHCSKVT